jgi:hypothetical protein
LLLSDAVDAAAAAGQLSDVDLDDFPVSSGGKESKDQYSRNRCTILIVGDDPVRRAGTTLPDEPVIDLRDSPRRIDESI